MKKVALAALVAAGLAVNAHAGTSTEELNVTGNLLIGCSVTPPAGGVDFGEQDADVNLDAPIQDFSLEVSCRSPYRITWADGGSTGSTTLDVVDGASAGYVFLMDSESNPITESSGPAYEATEDGETDIVSLKLKVSSDEEGQRQLAAVTDLDGAITLQVEY